MQNFNSLRNKYKEIIYKDFKIYETKNDITIRYFFEIPELTKFEPFIIIEKRNIKFKKTNNNIIKNIAFNIGMVELISYWKCVCTPKIIIKCAKLDDEQIKFFKKLFYLGLGEFRYKNNIKIDEETFVEIVSNEDSKLVVTEEKEDNLIGTLIPVGGGKDSNVTLEVLKNYSENNYCLLIGGKEPSIKSANIAGYKDKIIYVTRRIDKNLLELNKQGYLNGHTPFSALLAFLSYLIAYLTNRKYIALSNEVSSNESNVTGKNINHQYSKTFEFEQDFREYAEKYLKTKVEYFSLLRPLNELQIAKLFSKNEEYHSIFKSCNEGSKTIPWEWCCKCPKCLFVYIILSPFLYKDKLIKIFKQDLFKQERLEETFKELCGYGETKPFECVGTYEEVNYAITKTILNLKDKELPYLLKYYKENYGLVNINGDITKRYNENNNLPKEFDEILRKEIL